MPARKKQPVDLHRFKAERVLANDSPRQMLITLINVTTNLIDMLPTEARKEGRLRVQRTLVGDEGDLAFRRGLMALSRRTSDEQLAAWARAMSDGLMGALLTLMREPMPDEARDLLFQIYFDVAHALKFASRALLDGAFDNPRSTRRRRFVEFTVRLHTFANVVRATMNAAKKER